MSQILAGFALGSLTGFAGQLLQPTRRNDGYVGNRLWPSFPAAAPVAEIIRAYWAGRFTPPDQQFAKDFLESRLAEHGVFTRQTGDDLVANSRKYCWHSMIQNSRPFLPITEYLAAERYELPYPNGPSPWLLRFNQLSRREGFFEDPERYLLTNLGRPPDVAEVLDWWRRDMIDKDLAERFIRWSGVVETEHIDRVLRMRYFRIPAERQLFEAYYRLTPDQIGRYAAEIPGVVSIPKDFAYEKLRQQGWDEFYLPMLDALNRPQIQHRQVLMGVQLGIRDDQFVRDKATLEGYLSDDVEYFVDLGEAHRMERGREQRIRAIEAGYVAGSLNEQEARQQLTEQRLLDDDIDNRLFAARAEFVARETTIGREMMIRTVEELYDVGTLDPAQAGAQLGDLGLTTDVIKRRLTAIDAKHVAGLVKETLAVVRREFLGGSLNPAEVDARLKAVGINQERIRVYLALWTVQLTAEQRVLSTGEILSLLAECMIDEDTALLRLKNLNWINADALLLISRSKAACVRREAAIAAAQARSQKAAVAEIERQQASVKKQADELLREKQRQEPLRDLKQMYARGVIDGATLADRMTEYKYPMQFIDYTLKLIEGKKGFAGSPGGKVDPRPPVES